MWLSSPMCASYLTAVRFQVCLSPGTGTLSPLELQEECPTLNVEIELPGWGLPTDVGSLHREATFI